MRRQPAPPQVVHREIGPSCRVSSFEPPGGAAEHHLFLEPESDGPFDQQLEDATREYHRAVESLGLDRPSAVFRRCFVSDAANQLDRVMASPLGLGVPDPEAAAVSCIQQPPVMGRKLAVWAYHIGDVRPDDKSVVPVPDGGPHARTLVVRRGEHSMLWTSQLTGAPGPAEGEGPAVQTERLFGAYAKTLRSQQATLLRNTVRTWVFVQHVDSHYEAMVDARRELFARHGLEPRTHYIVSTGIEGRTADPRNWITLDAVAECGLSEEEVDYIDRLDHLNRTDEYGVTFERAVRLNYADRSHVYVAGTASIGPDGSVLHEGRIVPQVERTVENIRALLEESRRTWQDVASMIVYLRDLADARRVRSCLDIACPGVPYAMVWAPVCRPTWLVEIEVVAIGPNQDTRWPRY